MDTNQAPSLWSKFTGRFHKKDSICRIERRGTRDFVVWLRDETGEFLVAHVTTKPIAADIVTMLTNLDLESRKRVIERCASSDNIVGHAQLIEKG